MPRKIDPGTIKIGGGLRTSQSEPTNLLGETSASFTEHVTTFSGAHTAASITIDGHPPQFLSRNVEGALDELSALIPPRPAVLGVYRAGIGSPGIPDWGILKLEDSPLDERDGIPDWGYQAEIYGYYYTAPVPRLAATIFAPRGADDVTDPTFNAYDVKLPGGGPGQSHAGAFTRIVGLTNPAIQSMRLIPSSGTTGGQEVTLSGVLYPADRGVLALLHWPAGGDMADFLAQDLQVRCPAALLLGLGVASGCDGQVGGIFTLGEDGGNYDPFAFPGQATGQYDLEELHTGLSTIDSSPLPITANYAAGQVRLGTDPGAGPVVTNGITILGGGASSRGAIVYPSGFGNRNFFRYRLPYLSDYSSGTLGLPYTPTAEKSRYFMKPDVSLDPLTDLTQAGDYVDFPADYWTFQVARYRHVFLMDSTLLLPGVPREDGTYIFLHFKTEAAFEALVRDGVAPADTDLYSRNLVDWTNPESPVNIAANEPSDNYPQASSYSVVRSAVYEDPAGVDDPTVTIASFAIDRNGGVDNALVTWVSGVAYYSPITSVGASPFRIDELQFTALDLFANTYHTAEPGVSAGNAYLGNMNPAVINLAPFSYEGTTMVVGFTPKLVARQRLEFGYDNLGAYSITNGPLSTDVATFDAGTSAIQFLGDTQSPAFSQDAKMRLFLRRPLGHTTASTTILPFPSVAIPEVGGKKILFHSTKGSAAEYGNIETTVGSGVPTSFLQTALKDVSERFLDEVYRYRMKWDSGTLPALDAANLLGPGLPSGAANINLPVRAGKGSTYGSPWDSVSWFAQLDFSTRLFNVPGTEAQVAGLPERAPSLDWPLHSPFPSCGILIYPKHDYSTGYRPSLADGDLTAAQWDYSGVTGDCSWNRAFDVRFSRSGNPVAAVGQPYVKLKILGLRLEDFAYSAPGPGSTAIAIFAKVPGQTTWMDIGRAEGEGPGKQDTFDDGAGCQVAGAETFNGVDVASKLVYCQVKINVGPDMFQNTLDEVPILIKVTIKDSTAGKNLDFTQVSATGNPGSLRGLVGIEIVRP